MLTKCRECKKEVSSEAPSCPHCGIRRPAWEQEDRRQYRIATIIIIVFLGCLMALTDYTDAVGGFSSLLILGFFGLAAAAMAIFDRK